ncbi:polysaccharide biosynthesis C-terminal domain-containing protein [Luteirhabdus pelagi]|uniref:polysaccharide biosynthesis C-terminal domain-containing protein n=1 Tax=Luteirhabdus pelagi TaxID=2792783 RepID=UPI00193A259F|nr:NAD-dependent epimerase/dehydratase family protein [Luteirhabdus pelagi]
MEVRKKVGITGQSGFMGQHLYNYLGLFPDEFTRVEFERSYFQDDQALEQFVASCDVIVHLAAMNRHDDPQVIYDNNIELVQKLVHACEAAETSSKIIFSSSTQEERDNHYGKSKREGRKVFQEWAHKSGGQLVSMIIPNVFGPFGKPYYNSVVATFCHQLTHDETPAIHQDGTVNLIYINELCEEFLRLIRGDQQESSVTETIVPPHAIKVSSLLKLLQEYKSDYLENGEVPDLTDAFQKALFNTFRSYIPMDYFPRKFTQHSDDRGAFVEIMRADTPGQSSYSTTVPGITRGNHYHTRKMERFAVIKGQAIIQLRKINTKKVYEFMLNGDTPAYVDMPIWVTHNIKNVGDTELITLFWINEPFDPKNPDTYYETV